MLLQQTPPGDELKPWIHSYRQYTFSPSDRACFSCLPGTGGELWLPQSGRLAAEARQVGAGLLCLRSCRLEFRQVGLRLFAIRFRAGALPFFTDQAYARLIDRYTPIGLLCDEAATGQLTTLQHSESFAEQCLLAERFLLARRSADRRLAAMQRLAATLYEESAGFSLNDYAARVQRDRSHLSRQFRETQGVSAKYFHRLCRFERFLRDALFSDAPSLAGLAADHGYYDQAHMHHDVRELCRQSPRRLLADRVARLFYSARPTTRFCEASRPIGN